MALKLAQLAANKATTSFPYLGETVNLTYIPSLITEEYLDTIQRTANTIDALSTNIVHVLSAWDVEEDDGNVMPLTVERLRSLDMSFLRTVFQAVMKEVAQGEANGTSPSTPLAATSKPATLSGSTL